MFCSCPGNRLALLKKKKIVITMKKVLVSCACRYKATFKNLSLHLHWMKAMPGCACFSFFIFPIKLTLTANFFFSRIQVKYYYINSKYLNITMLLKPQPWTLIIQVNIYKNIVALKREGWYLNGFCFIDIWLKLELNEIPVYKTVIPSTESSLFFQ